MSIDVRFERCLGGRLNDAYPVARHDLEVRFAGDLPAGEALTGALELAYADAIGSDPSCRKVVFAAPAGGREAIAAAEAAGFRYVVDVDVPDHDRSVVELSLLVREPEHVTRIDPDLDRIPDS